MLSFREDLLPTIFSYFFEVFHYMRNNQARKRGSMALKLDMSKAMIEWSGITWLVF